MNVTSGLMTELWSCVAFAATSFCFTRAEGLKVYRCISSAWVRGLAPVEQFPTEDVTRIGEQVHIK